MRLFEYCKGHHEVAIYGAGGRGKELYGLMKQAGIKVSNFIVSKFDGTLEYDGIAVREFDEWNSKYVDDGVCGLVVAVSDRIADPIKEKIVKSGLADWYYAGDYDTVRVFRREVCPVDASKFLYSTVPVSTCFGGDRGKSICRYHLEKFLDLETKKLHNIKSVTEVGENLYSAMYFPNADCDIIFYNEGTDLTKTSTLNKEKYDCFFCTQVFNFIYDVKAAIQGAYYLLKSGGTLLGSVAGNISPVSRTDMKLWGHYWGFTYLGIELLLADVFGKENVVVKPLGNVVSAVAYTQGLCLEDISDTRILDYDDENYPIVIGFAAHKRKKEV